MKLRLCTKIAAIGIGMSLASTLIAQQDDGSSPIYSTQPRGSLSVSRDGGKSWAPLSAPSAGSAVIRLLPDPSDEDLLYAVSSDGMLFASSDGGHQWRTLAALPERLDPSGPVALATDAEDPATLWYAGTGLWRFSTEKQGWERVLLLKSGARLTAVASSPADAESVLAADEQGYVYRVSNALRPVPDIRVEISLVHPARINSLAFDPIVDDRVIALLAEPAGAGALGLVWESLDGGQHWKPLDFPAVDSEEGEDTEPPVKLPVPKAPLAAAATSPNCAPTFNPSPNFILTRSAQKGKKVRIDFKKVANPADCQFFSNEGTEGTIVITNIKRDFGNRGGGTVTYNVLENTKDGRCLAIRFDIRRGTSGPTDSSVWYKFKQRGKGNSVPRICLDPR